jgi:putative SOS response-associated peptidase YedK
VFTEYAVLAMCKTGMRFFLFIARSCFGKWKFFNICIENGSYMCGRYSLVTSARKIHDQLSPEIQVPAQLPLNYNVAPTQEGLVVTNDDPGKAQLFRWGLVPSWSKDNKGAARLINARSEGIESKPSFRVPFRKRRCLVVADSFYEWRKEGDRKIPYRIMLPNDKLLLMAGLWDVWYEGERPLQTFTIITTTPNAEMEKLHNRMPVMLLDEKQQSLWLDNSLSVDDSISLLHPPPDQTLLVYRVPETVNNVRNNGPDLHQRVEEQQPLL